MEKLERFVYSVRAEWDRNSGSLMRFSGIPSCHHAFVWSMVAGQIIFSLERRVAKVPLSTIWFNFAIEATSRRAFPRSLTDFFRMFLFLDSVRKTCTEDPKTLFGLFSLPFALQGKNNLAR